MLPKGSYSPSSRRVAAGGRADSVVTMTKTTKKAKASASSVAKKQSSNAGARKQTGRRKVSAVEQKNWKPISKKTKSFVLDSFDSGMRLLMHNVPEKQYEEVHSALVKARNQVAVKLDTLKAPPPKQDYNTLSTVLADLKETKERLRRCVSAKEAALERQTRELETLEEEKTRLEIFSKDPSKYHPLLLEPMEKELFLNFDKS